MTSLEKMLHKTRKLYIVINRDPDWYLPVELSMFDRLFRSRKHHFGVLLDALIELVSKSRYKYSVIRNYDDIVVVHFYKKFWFSYERDIHFYLTAKKDKLGNIITKLDWGYHNIEELQFNSADPQASELIDEWLLRAIGS